MQIAIIAHDMKKELMAQFCIAYCGTLSKHNICATSITGKYVQEATGLEIVMWDERRTTVEAHNILSQHNYHGKKRKDTVDAVAASLILEGYLASRGR